MSKSNQLLQTGSFLFIRARTMRINYAYSVWAVEFLFYFKMDSERLFIKPVSLKKAKRLFRKGEDK